MNNLNVSAAVFQSKRNCVGKAVNFFKNVSKIDRVFQDVYDCHLILGGKQRLKQLDNYSMIPWPSFDTHQTYKRAMIREVQRDLSLFSNFFNDDTTLNLFPQDMKIPISVFVFFRVLTKSFLRIISKKLSKTQNSINQDFVSLQNFRGPSPTVY